MSHDYYNRESFPVYVGQASSENHEIWADANGRCAAIPSKLGATRGCEATHFGDAKYVRVTLGLDVLAAIALAHA